MAHRIMLLPYLILSTCFLSTAISPLKDSQRGVLFNFQRKILLAERYINVRFVVPFPSIDISISSHLSTIASNLDSMWQVDTHLCQLNYTRMKSANLTINWTFRRTTDELENARNDLKKLVMDTNMLLADTREESESTRDKTNDLVL